MGEFHFSRYSGTGWEDAILKMKAGGIDIIATYIFGSILKRKRVSGIGKIIEIYCILHLFVRNIKYIYSFRIGPWAHGNIPKWQGILDWLLRNKTYYQNVPKSRFLQKLLHQISKSSATSQIDRSYLFGIRERILSPNSYPTPRNVF